ncbi:MAG: N-acetylneuraminate synthase family protein [Spirochaetales bacterium]|nr:N-acetylneuraminate synthase family protein [Spirochaetales bacterium]
MNTLKQTENNSVFIIAEIGTSHNGSLTRAEELIRSAAESGANCVKTQIVFADEIIHPETGEVKLPGGNIRLYDNFKKLEQDFDFYQKLKEITEEYGLEFLASPFGQKSLDWLLKLNCKRIKIASPELNHFPLLKDSATSGKEIILSTGVSLLSDIEAALKSLTSAGCVKNNISLLHCITSYPAPEEEYNLLILKTLSDKFQIRCGISDHSKNPLLVPLTSVYTGSTIIEKHITLKKEDGGLDDPIALEPEEFKQMCEGVRAIEKLQKEEQFNFLIKKFNDEKIKNILGNGKKLLAESEKANYGRTNRSIHALNSMSAGTILTKKNTAILRTEKKLKPGIRPEYYDSLIGKKIIRDVKNGEGIRSEDLGIKKEGMNFPL